MCEDLDESEGVSSRLAEEIPEPQPPETTQYNRHCYECDSCGTQIVAIAATVELVAEKDDRLDEKLETTNRT